MRVISGKAKGRKLKQVPGDSTRPIMDRVKENLFNLVRLDVADSRWLDLFAGTGQVGIEALSNGAKQVIFVDNMPAAIKIIKQNLRYTQLESGAIVRKNDAFAFLENFSGKPFDFIFIAPPQYKKLWEQALIIIEQDVARFLAAWGQVVVQIDPKEFVPVECRHLTLSQQRLYGNTLLCFYEKKEATD